MSATKKYAHYLPDQAGKKIMPVVPESLDRPYGPYGRAAHHGRLDGGRTDRGLDRPEEAGRVAPTEGAVPLETPELRVQAVRPFVRGTEWNRTGAL